MDSGRWWNLVKEEWLSWRDLAACAACSRGVLRIILPEEHTTPAGPAAVSVLRLAGRGKLTFHGSGGGDLNADGRYDVLDESHRHRDRWLGYLGRYLASGRSPVGSALFRSEAFRSWPAPGMTIAAALCGGTDHTTHVSAPAGCVEDCYKAWITKDDVVYLQDGYDPQQQLWRGAMRLTTPRQWQAEEEVRLEACNGDFGRGGGNHGLDYTLSPRLHVRPCVVLLRVGRAAAGLLSPHGEECVDDYPDLFVWEPRMPSLRDEETDAPFRRYCLELWEDVLDGSLPWTMQSPAHDFVRQALMDGDSFPWDGDCTLQEGFARVWDYLHDKRAPSIVLETFFDTWRRCFTGHYCGGFGERIQRLIDKYARRYDCNACALRRAYGTEGSWALFDVRGNGNCSCCGGSESSSSWGDEENSESESGSVGGDEDDGDF